MVAAAVAYRPGAFFTVSPTKNTSTRQEIVPPSQNKYLNFILDLIQSCIRLKTYILG